jgi:predicted transcriptional regulator YdeE
VRGIFKSNIANISKVVEHEGFSFIGRAAKTANEQEMKGEGVISSQWVNFYEGQLMQAINPKKNSSILAVYTNYESDETGTYTFALGAEVMENAIAPDGMEKIDIPASEYIIFTTRKGHVQEVVVEAWQEIWEWSQSNERAFIADFEVYDQRATDPENSQVDIFISVK